MNTELIVGKNKPECEKSHQVYKGVKQLTEKHLNHNTFSPFLTRHFEYFRYYFFHETSSSPKLPSWVLTWFIWMLNRAFISAKLGSPSWEMGSAAPSSVSSTLVTVKCGIALVRNVCSPCVCFLPVYVRCLSLPCCAPFWLWSLPTGDPGRESGSTFSSRDLRP